MCPADSGAPVRVLFVTAAGDRGGAEVTMERIARALDPARFAPVMAAPANSAVLSRWYAAGFETAGTPPVSRLSHVGETRAAINGIAAMVRDRGIGLIHTHGVAAQLHAGLAARRTRRPVVSHAQDIFDPTWTRNGLLHRLSLAVPRDLTIASSNAVATSLGGRGEAGSCEVIANPVETAIVAAIEPRPVSRRPLVVWCGRLQRWKGCHLFLTAARRVRDRHPEARFAVVGGSVFGLEPEYSAELSRQADTLGLTDCVEFTGQVEDARPWMRAGDVFVHSSERPEPFGLVMAEAMVQERPVVAFNHGGASEIVADGQTGRLVPPGNTDAMADAISSLLSDPALCRTWGLAARRRAVDGFGMELVARRVEAVYDRVIERRSVA